MNIEKSLELVLTGLMETADKEISKAYEPNKEFYENLIPSLTVQKTSLNKSLHKSFIGKRIKDIIREADIVISEENINLLTQFVNRIEDLSYYTKNFVNTGSCSVDKSNFILSSWVKSKLGKEIKEFPPVNSNKYSFFHPCFGSKEEWFALIDAYLLSGLQAEKIEELYTAYHVLKKEKDLCLEEKEEKNRIINEYFHKEYMEFVEKLYVNNLITKEDAKIMKKGNRASLVLCEIPFEDIKNKTVSKELLEQIILENIQEFKGFETARNSITFN